MSHMLGRVQVIDGPNNMQIMMSVFGEDRVSNPTTVSFQVGKSSGNDGNGLRFRINARIDGIDHEDGSNDTWFFNGYQINRAGVDARPIYGYYNSKLRTGWLEWGHKP